MVSPYTGGPPTNGSGYPPPQRYDSPSYDHARNNAAAAMNSRNMPAGNYASPQMEPNAYGSGRPDPAKAPRQQNQGGYQLSDPQSRALPPAPGGYGEQQVMTRPSQERQKSSTANGQRRPSGSRICGKCGEPLQGQFVRALDNTFHLDCFTCHVSAIHMEGYC